VSRRAAVLRAHAPARHAGRAQVLPSRLDRELSRRPARRVRLVPTRARAEPALLRPLVVGRSERGTPMKKLAVLLVLAAPLIAPVAAQPHPLGTFTITRFARVEVAGHRLYVRYVLDMAEIPTFEARQEGVSPAVYARRLAAGLHIAVDGQPVVLTPTAHAL